MYSNPLSPPLLIYSVTIRFQHSCVVFWCWILLSIVHCMSIYVHIFLSPPLLHFYNIYPSLILFFFHFLPPATNTLPSPFPSIQSIYPFPPTIFPALSFSLYLSPSLSRLSLSLSNFISNSLFNQIYFLWSTFSPSGTFTITFILFCTSEIIPFDGAVHMWIKLSLSEKKWNVSFFVLFLTHLKLKYSLSWIYSYSFKTVKTWIVDV